MLQIPIQFLIMLRGNWTPRFPRAWRGRKVTVVAHGRTYMLKMGQISSDYFHDWTLDYDEIKNLPPPHYFHFKDEGVTWCVGWTGKRVDALKVATALNSAVLRS